jgi:hypothetical protein
VVDFEEQPFTQNDYYLNDLRAKILAGLRELRRPGEKAEYEKPENRETVNAAFAELAKLAFEGLRTEDLAKLRPVDDYEEELIVMAETRAFWQLAYKVSHLQNVFLPLRQRRLADHTAHH